MEYIIYSSLLFLIILIFYQQKKINELYINKRVVNTILEYIPSMIFQMDINPNRSIKYLSKGAKVLTGYNAEDFYSNKKIKYQDLVYSIDIENIKTEMLKLTPENRTYRVEYRIITQQGNIKWLSENGVGKFNRHGKLVSIEGFIVDITERKSVEEFLVESNNRFMELIDQAPLGICISNNELISYSNPGYINMFGFPESKEIIGDSIYKNIEENSISILRESLEKIKSGEKKQAEFELTVKHGKGNYFPVQLLVSNVTINGIKSQLIFYLDITERKEAEEKIISINTKLSDIIDLIPDPTFVIDQDKKVTHWNLAIEELTGVKKEHVIGKGDYIYSEAFYGIKRPILIDLIDTPENQTDNIYHFVKKINNKWYTEYSGNIVNKTNWVYLWGVAAPLFDNKGNRFGAIEVIKDITEVKINEIALIDSEQKARIVLDSNQDYIIMVRPDGTILDCNITFASAFYKKREDLINTNIRSILNPDEFENWNKKIYEVLNSGQVKIQQYQYPNPIKYLLISFYPSTNENNQVDKIVIYIKDISKLKKTELALRESKARLQLITRSITDHIYTMIYDNELKTHQFLNLGNKKVFGYKDADFASYPNLWQTIVYKDDYEDLMQFLSDVLSNKKPAAIEHRLYHKNGEVVWISNTLLFFKNIDDNKVEYIGVIKDITARKQAEIALAEAEERYRRVFDQSGLANTVYDLNGNILMQNSFAASLLGGKTSDYIGKNIQDVFSPEISKLVFNNIHETLNNKSIIDEKFVQLPTGNYWFKMSNHPIKNDFGDIIAVQTISTDITEKKELDKKILNTIIETEEKERVNFAQELHDGLGPIISAIRMYINWLNMPDAKIPQSEILTDTNNLLEEASRTVREISFKLSPHILSNFGVVEAIRSYAEKIKIAKNIRIIVESNLKSRSDEITETILYRVLCECINNTIKHANASEIIIKFRCSGELCKITFLDDGKGFDAKAALNKKSGIGLLNIQNRIQSINGKFFINSNPQIGTKINISVKLEHT